MQHIHVALLCLQDEARSSRLSVRRVQSEHTLADVGTNALSRAVVATHAQALGYVNMQNSQPHS